MPLCTTDDPALAFPARDEISADWRFAPGETGRTLLIEGKLSLWDALRVFSIRSLVAATEAESGLVAELGGTSRFLAPVEAGRSASNG